MWACSCVYTWKIYKNVDGMWGDEESRGRPGKGGSRVVWCPDKNIHETLGHLGPKKMMECFHHYFWWKSMGKDAKKLCNLCGTCQTTKRTTRRQLGLLHPLPTPETPWSSIAMDFMGPFPTSLGYDYLWVIICRLTSTVHLIPIRTTLNALELAFVFIHDVVRLHGLPTLIVSDRDSKLTSRFWHELH